MCIRNVKLHELACKCALLHTYFSLVIFIRAHLHPEIDIWLDSCSSIQIHLHRESWNWNRNRSKMWLTHCETGGDENTKMPVRTCFLAVQRIFSKNLMNWEHHETWKEGVKEWILIRYVSFRVHLDGLSDETIKFWPIHNKLTCANCGSVAMVDDWSGQNEKGNDISDNGSISGGSLSNVSMSFRKLRKR